MFICNVEIISTIGVGCLKGVCICNWKQMFYLSSDIYLYFTHSCKWLNGLIRLYLNLQEEDGSEGRDQPSFSDSFTEDKFQLDPQAVDGVNNVENKDQGDIQVWYFQPFATLIHNETSLEISFWLESVLEKLLPTEIDIRALSGNEF